MKIGDKFPVTIAGQTVTQAVVKSMDKETATLVVPATLVVMGIRTEFDTPAPPEPETQNVLLGVERSSDNVEDVGPDESTPAQDTNISSENVSNSENVAETNAPVEENNA